ncbi:MAG: hypothetical protein G8345_20110, partial [Magnetococcales bacterium]|nr:hypothetical protein [Magnetococcales bacterium]
NIHNDKPFDSNNHIPLKTLPNNISAFLSISNSLGKFYSIIRKDNSNVGILSSNSHANFAENVNLIQELIDQWNIIAQKKFVDNLNIVIIKDYHIINMNALITLLDTIRHDLLKIDIKCLFIGHVSIFNLMLKEYGNSSLGKELLANRWILDDWGGNNIHPIIQWLTGGHWWLVEKFQEVLEALPPKIRTSEWWPTLRKLAHETVVDWLDPNNPNDSLEEWIRSLPDSKALSLPELASSWSTLHKLLPGGEWFLKMPPHLLKSYMEEFEYKPRSQWLTPQSTLVMGGFLKYTVDKNNRTVHCLRGALLSYALARFWKKNQLWTPTKDYASFVAHDPPRNPGPLEEPTCLDLYLDHILQVAKDGEEMDSWMILNPTEQQEDLPKKLPKGHWWQRFKPWHPPIV